MSRKYQAQRLDKVLSKYSKQSRLVGEIEECYNELSKSLEPRKLGKKIKDQYSKSQLEETIAKRFVFSFKNGNNDLTRDSFDEDYMSLVEIKDFNALIDNKPFFDEIVKNKQEACEKLVEISKNENYTTGNLLDYAYHQKIS